MKEKKQGKRITLILLLIIIVVIVIAIYFLRQEKPITSISGSGIIEAKEVDISAEIPARIIKLYYDEGDEVNIGDLIVVLDDSDYVKALEREKAAMRAAQSRLNDLLAGAREQELKRAEAELDAARASMEKAKADLERFQSLYEEDIISYEMLQSAETQSDVTRENWRAAGENLKLLDEGRRKDEIETAQWELKRAEAAVEMAKIKLGYTRIKAPTQGRILSKNFEEGELPVVGSPIMTLADIKNPWVKIYVGERYYGKVKLGQQAFVESDSFPARDFKGTVSFISSEAEFTPKNIQTKEERVKLVFAIKVSLDNEEEELKPGMPVDVNIPL